MAEIKAFRALRFADRAGKLEELVCPPYDIISEEERRAFLERNEHNIIRLELPREGENPYGVAGNTMKAWRSTGILACDDVPALYIYEEEFTALGERKKVRGVMCRVTLEPFENGVVLPHEETLSKAKTDRFNLMCATGCNFSAIYSLYFDEDRAISRAIDEQAAKTPDKTFTTDDGIVHRVWAVTDEAVIRHIAAAFAPKKVYIADGHHRYETALGYKKHLADQGALTPGHAANSIMMMLVNMEHEGLVVFPTHRIVRDLENFDEQGILAACEQYFTVREIDTTTAQQALDDAAARGEKAFVLYTGRSVLLTLKDRAVMDGLLPELSAAYKNLDVSILHTLLLEKLFGIDRENMANQKNLIYTRDAAEAMAAVDSGNANCTFLINATRVDEIAAVAGAGEKMPQKSTYFYPKLITGHVMNALDMK